MSNATIIAEGSNSRIGKGAAGHLMRVLRSKAQLVVRDRSGRISIWSHGLGASFIAACLGRMRRTGLRMVALCDVIHSR
jgi:hypothetical protein